MATHSIQTKSFASQANSSLNLNLLQKFNEFADRQQKWSMAYWIGSLMVIGSFFLPITFLLVYTLNGPVVPFLALSMTSFFISLIANMGGMGIRACIYSFFFSIVLHLAMILATVLTYIL
jgi:hypothetical protein